jgi:hypothetical protein
MQTSQPGEWKRIDGHWVTVAGVGTANEPDLLFIHNPAINRARIPAPPPGDYSPDAVELTPAPTRTLLLANEFTRDSLGMFAVLRARPASRQTHRRRAPRCCGRLRHRTEKIAISLRVGQSGFLARGNPGLSLPISPSIEPIALARAEPSRHARFISMKMRHST